MEKKWIEDMLKQKQMTLKDIENKLRQAEADMVLLKY